MKKIKSLTIVVLLFTGILSAQDKKEVVAIYPFTSATGYWDYALEVGNAIEAGVLRSGRFTVVERNRFASIKQEDRFKEVNTSDIVKQASKFGAKTIVTGHVVGVSQGNLVDSQGRSAGTYIEISLSFKIIDVESSEIKKSELLRGRGEGPNQAAALQLAYQVIDNLGRAQIGDYLPQTFKFASLGEIEKRKNGDFLKSFKFWGGSKEGLRANDVVQISYVNYLTNPNTGKKVEERTLLGEARIQEVHGESTSTALILNHRKTGQEILQLIEKSPESVILEYKGSNYVKPRGLFGL